ncbi:MAG: twin-arginine translocase TatA/TatE family subunit [Pseudobacteriovorax sp.]|nr:twin-arginine translocase TatA/TatE family subunit [Pseudobacteriovorax sp.]
MGLPGVPEMLIIGGVIVLLFGASKLPKLGGAIGESIKNFKKGVNDDSPKITEESEKKKDGSSDT